MSPTEVLRDVLVVLVFAKLAAEIAERIKMPAVVGEIVAGVLIGPSLLGLVDTSSALEVLAEFGVILLLLQVGMEMDIDDLAAVGKASVSVAVLGVILPMIGGYAVGHRAGAGRQHRAVPRRGARGDERRDHGAGLQRSRRAHDGRGAHRARCRGRRRRARAW